MKDIKQFMFAANPRQKKTVKTKSGLFHSLHRIDLVNPLIFFWSGKKNNPVFMRKFLNKKKSAARWIKAGDGISQLELQQVHLRGECRPCLFHTRKARATRGKKPRFHENNGGPNGCFSGICWGMKIFLPSYTRDHNKTIKRIPINQPG